MVDTSNRSCLNWLTYLSPYTSIWFLVFVHIDASILSSRWWSPHEVVFQPCLVVCQQTVLMAWLFWGRRWFAARFLAALLYPWYFGWLVEVMRLYVTLVISTMTISMVSFATLRLAGWRLTNNYENGLTPTNRQYSIADVLVIAVLISIAFAILRYTFKSSDLYFDYLVDGLKFIRFVAPVNFSVVCAFMMAVSRRSQMVWGALAILADSVAWMMAIWFDPNFAVDYVVYMVLMTVFALVTAIFIRIAGYEIDRPRPAQ